MRFRTKILFLCLFIYVVTLTFTAVFVSQNTYSSLLKNEIDRGLEEQKNIQSSVALFLIVNSRSSELTADFKTNSNKIVQTFSSKNNNIDIFNRSAELIASSTNASWSFDRKEELKSTVSSGRRQYILRWEMKQHYIFINDSIELAGQTYIISYIKNITNVDEKKNEQYSLFLRAAGVGLLFIAVIIFIFGTLLIQPIEELIAKTRSIASGNYKERVVIKSKDEIGQLAEQYNLMAEEIEKKLLALDKEAMLKQQFTDNLTHELRTPLTSILGYSELLSGMKYDEVIFNKGLNYINSEGNRMLKLINTLMDLILLRENDLNRQLCNVVPIFEDIKGLMSIKAIERKLSICIEGVDISLNIDKDLFKGLMINLVDNALKASGQNDVITIGSGISENSGETFIYVKDQGKGINEEDLNKIMTPFYRVDKARTRKEGGLGLGLTIVKAIADAHEAKMHIESKPNKGTLVKITFP